MGELAQRLGWKSQDELEQQAEADRRFSDAFLDRMHDVEEYDDIDEESRTLKPETAILRGIERLNDGLKKALEDYAEHHNGFLPSEFDDLVWEEHVDDVVFYHGCDGRLWTLDDVTDLERSNVEMRSDLRNNFLYLEYLTQLLVEDVEAIDVSYAGYSLYIALKAALQLMVNQPDGCAMVGLDPSVREAAVQFHEKCRVRLIDDTDVPLYVQTIITDVPGIWGAANTLLVEYSKAVRIERATETKRGTFNFIDSPLPDEDEGRLPRRLLSLYDASDRLTRAIAAYHNDVDGTSIKDLAREYGLRYDTLRTHIRELGITRSQGGDRKAKAKA